MTSETNQPQDDPSPETTRSRDAPNATDGGPTNSRPADPSERTRGREMRRRVLAATLQAEAELLERRCEDLETTNEDLEAEIDDLEAEIERKRRELREVVTRYERLLAEANEGTAADDAGPDTRRDGSTVLAATTRICNRILYPQA